MPGFALAPAALLSIWENGRRATPLQRAVALLAAVADVPVAEAAEWDVGSRDVTLARILAVMGGSPAWGSVTCDGCAADLEVPVDVAAVAGWPVSPPGTLFTVGSAGGSPTFRLPTSADLAAVGRFPPPEARLALLARCVPGEPPDDVTAVAVEAAMEAYAPAAALTLAVACPECGVSTSAGFDAASLLWELVRVRAAALLRDVHALATAYGWTEPQVLALGDDRRAAYLEMVAGD